MGSTSATSKALEEWSAVDKLAALIQAAGFRGTYYRERIPFPKQLARWRQLAEDANNYKAPSMSDQKVLWCRRLGLTSMLEEARGSMRTFAGSGVELPL